MKLIILSGPCGSGKSTKAWELAASAEHALWIVQYDQHRDVGKEPGAVTEDVFRAAGIWLRAADSRAKLDTVVIDACNLHEHDRVRWEAVAWAFGAELEWITLPTPVEECVARDAERADPVGASAIRGQLVA